MQTSKIAIFCIDQNFFAKAESLSRKTEIPLTTTLEKLEFVLEVGEQVGLRALEEPTLSPLILDFKTGAVDFRRRFGNKGGQLILKAVGGAGRRVLDCTAGLGKDMFILASFNCQVNAFEKSTVVGALTCDALERARADEKLREICDRITYSVGNSLEHLQNVVKDQYDAIYLDPMFAKKSKSALPKKDLRVLQLLLAEENDSIDESAKALLSLARAKCRRVVVKRPQNGKALDDRKTLEFKGSSTRFDVYVS